MVFICGCVLLIYLTTMVKGTQNIESHLYHLNNLTASNHRTIHEDVSFPAAAESTHHVQTPQEYLRNLEGLLTHTPQHLPHTIYRNSHLADFEADQKVSASQSFPMIQLYRVGSPAYQDPTNMYQGFQDGGFNEWNFQKKNDFGKGQNFGWDSSFQQGWNMGEHGSSGQSGGILKKGKDAKALFILMAPLILLAVFGPILATQAMIPWVTNGGITTVSTIAGGRRRKRQAHQNPDPRQAIELAKRLQLFLEVQDFIAKTGSQDLVEEMGEAFLKCQKFTERRNKCLERVACEYTDKTSLVDPEERRIGRMVLRNVMTNPLVPAALTGKLNKGSLAGRNRPGHCKNYWCEAVDSRSNVNSNG